MLVWWRVVVVRVALQLWRVRKMRNVCKQSSACPKGLGTNLFLESVLARKTEAEEISDHREAGDPLPIRWTIEVMVGLDRKVWSGKWKGG